MKILLWSMCVLLVVAGSWGAGPWVVERLARVALFAPAQAATPPEPLSDAAAGVSVHTVMSDLEQPWDLAFLGEHEILVTEKAGRLWRVDVSSGARTAVSGVPEVTVHGQGGLHAVVLHPQFSRNGLVYLSYAAPGEKGRGTTTHVARGTLEGAALKDVHVLLRAQAATGKGQHFGGAMAFDRAGYLYVSVGDRGEREQAQNLSTHHGKILRLHDDGRVPADNPFVETPDARPEIWSYGHRNPQGLALDATTGTIWSAEHGPQGGDEINRIERGRNYGWPVITYGREYVTGFKIGQGTTRADVTPPVHYYVPSIATAGIAFYAHEAHSPWKNSVFVAALRGHLNRVQLDPDGRVLREERLLADRHLRVRAVRVSPSGALWVVADQGVVLKVAAGRS